MAKKTAAQKGYRKTVKKKPFLTKKELIALIIILVVVIGGFILIQNLPDGFIGKKEIQPGDIVSYAANDNKTRFLKLADANELDGFTRVNSAEGVGPLPTYTYTPNEENGNITSVTVTGSAVEASQLSDSILAYFTSADSTSHATEKIPTTVQGHDAYVFSYSYAYYDETKAAEAPAEEAAEEAVEEAAEETAEETAEEAAEAPAEEAAETPNAFSQSMTMNVDIDGTHTIALHVYLDGDDDSFFIPDEEILDYVMPYAEAFTIVEPKAK